jgi:tetratricopeptide (TPR) repeat protein
MLARHLRAEELSVYSHAPWDEVPDAELPPPPLREGLGRAHLPVSTRVPLAQAYFDQGLRLLHLGWGAEARRSFAEASRRDPGLAMAWWGLALARGPGGRHIEARTEAIGRALALGEGTTDLEQRLVIAASVLVEKGPANGRHAFVREMEALIDCYPEEAEARLLLAGFLMDGYEVGRPGIGQPYAQALLRDLLRTHPDHEGVHHAWVCAMLDSPRPEVARESALRLVELAPRVGPALVNAGRLLLRVGHTEEGHKALEAAIEADDAYLAAEALPASAGLAAERAMRWLVLGCAEGGRYREGQAWARRLRQRVEAEGNEGQAALFAATTLAGLHHRFGFWLAAADVHVELSPDAPAAERGLHEGLRQYTRGLAALEAGRLGDAAAAFEALEALHTVLAEEPRAEGPALSPGDVARVVELAATELRGSLEARRGDSARAEATLTHAMRLERRLRAVGPAPFSRSPRETLARVRLRFEREEKALELAQALAAERPGSGHARLLVAEARAALGDFPEAVRDFSLLLERWCCADAHLPELKRARAFLASRGSLLRVVGSEERMPVPVPAPAPAPASAQVLVLRPLETASG